MDSGTASAISLQPALLQRSPQTPYPARSNNPIGHHHHEATSHPPQQLVDFETDDDEHSHSHSHSTSSPRHRPLHRPSPSASSRSKQHGARPADALALAHNPSSGSNGSSRGDKHRYYSDDSNEARATPPVRRRPVASKGSQGSIATRKSSLGGKDSAATSNRPFSPPFAPRNLDDYPHSLSSPIPESPIGTSFASLPPEQARQILLNLDLDLPSPSIPSPPHSPAHIRGASDPHRHQSPLSRTMSTTATQLQRSASLRPQLITTSPPTSKEQQQQKSQASSKITAFFGWGGGLNTNPNTIGTNATNANANTNTLRANYIPTTPIAESSPTTISSDRSTPEASPYGYGRSPTTFATASIKSMPMPPQIDVTKANAPLQQASYFPNQAHPQVSVIGGQRPPTPAMSLQLEEMEEELRDLGAELAASIRREMELEDDVERLQNGAPSRRTSDYYSDEGTGDGIRARIGLGQEERSEEVEKIRRKVEVEKAQMRLQLGNRAKLERERRRAAEDRVRELEVSLQSGAVSGGPPARTQELELALEDSKRKWLEERQQRENYEDLLNALKTDLVQHQNERDNLRDEVVPQLNARLAGLEANDAELQRLTYENARLQQTLKSAGQRASIASIEEEGAAAGGKARGVSIGLSRSASLMRGAGLGRSNSVKAGQSSSSQSTESRDSLAERVKEIEAQRDALHRALKSLLDRQRFQMREHEKRVTALEAERNGAMEASSPRRRAYAAEVKDLRYEINELRRRADDALDGKWTVEKSLGGLKQDLDRAEMETNSLRALLKENEIVVPEAQANTESSKAHMEQHAATSASLERAYKELRDAQDVGLAQLRRENGVDGANHDAAIDTLLQSMQATAAERDLAQRQAATYKAKVETLAETQSVVAGENASLATQLAASGARIGSLSAQVQRQLAGNAGLRERLAQAVGKGEREQRDSADRITALQGTLRKLEDRLVAAQADSEDKVTRHEADVREMRSGDQGKRIKRLTTTGGAAKHSRDNSHGAAGLRTPVMMATLGAGMRTAASSSGSSIKSPRLNKNAPNVSLPEALRTEFLETRVRELEGALAEAEGEMQQVVQRMNVAQIEVLDLQSQRDEAMKQTATLQDKVVAESKTMGGIMGRWGMRS